MNEYFYKLNAKHNYTMSSFKIGEEHIRYGIEKDNTYYGIVYYKIDWLTEHSPLGYFPSYMHDKLLMLYMEINHAVYPHTDSNINMTLNFYLNTTHEHTNFYELNTNSPRLTKLENQTNGSVYELSDLDKVCSFSANAGDICLLNVSKVHSVMDKEVIPLQSPRRAIVVNSPLYTYEEVMNSLVI